MELALSAFAALGASATTTAAVGLTAAETAAAVASAGVGAASWAAGTTVAAAGATSGALGALSTVATVGSMISSIVGGYAGYRQSQDQAAIGQLNADAARLEASEQALRIRRELVQKVGQARVAFAASGTDISSGTAIEQGYRAEADFETSLARTGGTIKAAGAELQSNAYRTRGYGSLVEAAGRAFGAGTSQALSIARRG